MNTKIRCKGENNGFTNVARIDFDKSLSGNGKAFLKVGNKTIERDTKGTVCLLPIPDCDTYEVGIKINEDVWQKKGGKIVKSIQVSGSNIYTPIPNFG